MTLLSRARLISSPGQIIESGAILCAFLAFGVNQLNAVFKFVLFLPTGFHAIALWLSCLLFLLLSTLPLSLKALKKLCLESYSRPLATGKSKWPLLAMASGFVVLTLACNDFQILWPSPVPISFSLFVVVSSCLKSKTMFDRTIYRFGFMVVMLTAYIITTGLYKQQFDLRADLLFLLLGACILLVNEANQQPQGVEELSKS